MTDDRDAADRKRRAPRKRPESEVDRAGLARIVSDRLDELRREKGITQEEVAQRVGCSPATLRKMKNGTGDSHYGYALLTKVATILGLPKDHLVNVFHSPVHRDPEPPSCGAMEQWLENQLASHHAKMHEEITGMRDQLKGVANEVHEIKSLVESFVDVNQSPAE